MSRAAIVSPTVSPRDAVGHDVLAMQGLLRAMGHEVSLFTSQWLRKNPSTRDVSEVETFLAGDPSGLLVYHHATGWQSGVELVVRSQCLRIVRYHNVTPARFFSGYCPGHMKLSQQGREQLVPLAQAGCALYLSASAYNEGELIAAGADPARCCVVPPFHQVDRLAGARADPEVLKTCQDGSINLLFVGRRAPNKGHRFLLDVLAAYAEHFEPRARLLLVGKEDPALRTYGNQLRAQARRLNLHNRVVFIAEATEETLRAYYQSAHVLVVTSEHEGFCVPIIEAMALGVPVVAYGTTAVPQTVGDAGLVWEEPDPFLLAQSIDCLVRRPAVRERLIERGRRRFDEHFSNERITQRFREALGRLQRPAA